ncbi:MAG: HTH-type transcriptional regulator BhcR [Parvibaculaceae bacterium]
MADIMEKRQRGRPRGLGADAGAVKSLERALHILSRVAESDGQSLSEIAAATGLPAPTVYRMLVSLEGFHMVEFDQPAQLWSVGVGAYRLGAAFLRRRKLVDRARLAMQDLARDTGETANLGVAEDDSVVFVSQVETHQAIRAFFRPGQRTPFHASGIGKAMLAHFPPDRIAHVVGQGALETFTAKTLSSAQSLTADLDEIRKRGWSLDDEERYPGMRCIAAAIFNEHGEPLGGISVSGPTMRLTPERVADIAAHVCRAAANVTEMIGGQPPG